MSMFDYVLKVSDTCYFLGVRFVRIVRMTISDWGWHHKERLPHSGLSYSSTTFRGVIRHWKISPNTVDPLLDDMGKPQERLW